MSSLRAAVRRTNRFAGGNVLLGPSVPAWAARTTVTTPIDEPPVCPKPSEGEALSDLANELQAAFFVAARLKAKALGHLDDVGSLQDALRRAVAALRTLQRRS
jgi:hypothetical protein